MKTLKISVQKLMNNYLDCIGEIALDNRWCSGDVKEDINTIASRNMEGIRKLFIDGYTCMIVGGLMDLIDTDCPVGMEKEEIEIRIYNGEFKPENLLGVIINKEINY